MGRYQVKTRSRTFEAPNSAELALLVQRGEVAPEDLLRELPEGRWMAARLHPEIGRLFRSRDDERTAIVAVPAPPPDEDDSEGLWVRTRQSVVPVRDHETLRRLCKMGALKADDAVGERRDGPFTPLGQHPRYGVIFDSVFVRGRGLGPGPVDAARPVDAAARDAEADEVSDVDEVITLNEAELEYLDAPPPTASSGAPTSLDAREPQSSDIIALREEDLEPLNSGDHRVVAAARGRRELEPPPTPPLLPDVAGLAGWRSFRDEMNKAASHLVPQERHKELTWDLFRSMMQRATPSGPGERTWNCFRARVERHRHIDAHDRGQESTWSRFRELMMRHPSQPPSENTWGRFVRTLRQRHERSGLRPPLQQHRLGRGPRWPMAIRNVAPGRAIVGEARIKSVIVRRRDVMPTPGKPIRVNGLEAEPPRSPRETTSPGA